MKLFASLFTLSLLLFLGIQLANSVYSANAADPVVVLADAKDTKATISNDLKIAYEKSTPEPMAENPLVANLSVILLGLLSFAEVIVRITPTATDNSIVNYLAKIINAIIPNRKKGGGLL